MWPLLLAMHAQAAEYTHSAARDVHFTLALSCGSLTFHGGKDPIVRVRGDFGEPTPTFEGTDKELRFVVPHDQPPRPDQDCDLSVDVTMPTDGSLDTSSTNGDVSVNAIHGRIVVETVNGDVRVIDPGPEIRVTAVNGEIDVDELRGEAELTTVNGDITLDAGDLQDLKTQTVNGDTQVKSKKVRRLRSQTVNGDITFAGTLDPAARLELESHAGDITLRIPSEPGYVLALESFSGEIENRASAAAATRPQYGPGTHLDTTVGSGGARIDARSFSGDIVIEPPTK
jgi:DUF4097 and DUF4098 domain-containing protein YvlB